MKQKLMGNLVEEYTLGNTRIKIYDTAFAGKTKEDIHKILKRISKISIKAYSVEEFYRGDNTM